MQPLHCACCMQLDAWRMASPYLKQQVLVDVVNIPFVLTENQHGRRCLLPTRVRIALGLTVRVLGVPSTAVRQSIASLAERRRVRYSHRVYSLEGGCQQC